MKHIIYILIATLVFWSCEEVIDLELDTTEAQLVIECNIYNQPGPYYVTLSNTVDFDEPSEYPPVSEATVIISNNHGVVDTLTETEAGTYATSQITGIIGYTYNLTVIADGVIYTSSSTMQPPVTIDSIYYDDVIFGNEEQITMSFNDPKGVDNYYRVIRFINGVQQDGFSVLSDELNDGKRTTYSYISMDDDNVSPGDEVTFWLVSIDERVYNYFRTAGGDMTQSASPANPNSNIDGDVLGFFNACSFSSKSIVAQ